MAALGYGKHQLVFQLVTKLPAPAHTRAVTRDIAVTVAAAIPAAALQDTIRAAGGETLRDCRVFDVYTGAPIPPGFKSVAFSLSMRADDQTLTDEHADAIMKDVLKALKAEHNAILR